MREDLLTDGQDIFGEDIMPRPGDRVRTDFDKAASTGLGPVANSEIKPARAPTWIPWHGRDGLVNLTANNLCSQNDDAMC